jgi:hypothetical protein
MGWHAVSEVQLRSRQYFCIVVQDVSLNRSHDSLPPDGVESTGLDVADALSGILANPLGFLNRGAWRKSSLLLAFAGPIW